jgi:outer membrane protein
MKNPIRFVILAALCSALSTLAAEPAVKLAVVDLAKLFDSHYKTAEQQAKLRSDEQKAEEEIGPMVKERNGLVEEYKKLTEQANSPILNPDAKAKLQADAQKKLEIIQGKQNELQAFANNARATLEQRQHTFRTVMLEELTKISTEVARRRGANVLFDKAGPSQFGVPSLLFADAAFDITDDVMKEIDKDRPASATTAPAKDSGSLRVPALPPKK